MRQVPPVAQVGRTEGVREMSKERELLKKIHYCWICATDLDDEDPEIKALNEVMREAEHYLFHEPEAEPWQSLTDEDRRRFKNYWKQPGVGVYELIDAIEQALKEKNT
jgi:hypothetical protein